MRSTHTRAFTHATRAASAIFSIKVFEMFLKGQQIPCKKLEAKFLLPIPEKIAKKDPFFGVRQATPTISNNFLY